MSSMLLNCFRSKKQVISPPTNTNFYIGDKQYKCFVSHKSGKIPVRQDQSTPSYSGDTTNWNWVHPITLLNPTDRLTPPITCVFKARFNARFSNRWVIGFLDVDSEQGRILTSQTATQYGCCVWLNRTITLTYNPEWLKLYFYMQLSQSNQGMAMYTSPDVNNPILRCTDTNGIIYNHY